MKLIVQPDHGVEPVLAAIARARSSVEIVIFRLDVKDVALALETAVTRGVAVRALIAHTNKGGEKQLRKLEMRLLAAGVTVSRSADDWLRYHGKMLVIDGRQLHVNGFNFTWLDIDRSRSFGAITTSPTTREGSAAPVPGRLRPSAVRAVLRSAGGQSRDIAHAVERLPRRCETAAVHLRPGDLRSAHGARARRPGPRRRRRADHRQGLASHRRAGAALPSHRLHVRAIIRDGARAFLGSQSLRTLELDKRREIGVLITERPAVRGMLAVFDADWKLASAAAKVSSAAARATTRPVRTRRRPATSRRPDADADACGWRSVAPRAVSRNVHVTSG